MTRHRSQLAQAAGVKFCAGKSAAHPRGPSNTFADHAGHRRCADYPCSFSLGGYAPRKSRRHRRRRHAHRIGYRQHKIRLAGIDAPERRQPHYETARQNLAKLAFGKMVTVEWHKRDLYGRLVANVIAERRDVGLAQVRAGLAWWFRKYAHEQSSFERSLYESAELDAQRNKRGLWNSPKRTPPWEWRATRGVL
jgi:endonuclease YncB( thermonuclease family)